MKNSKLLLCLSSEFFATKVSFPILKKFFLVLTSGRLCTLMSSHSILPCLKIIEIRKKIEI